MKSDIEISRETQLLPIQEITQMLQYLKKAEQLRPMFLRTTPKDQYFEFYLEDKDFQKLVLLVR